MPSTPPRTLLDLSHVHANTVEDSIAGWGVNILKDLSDISTIESEVYNYSGEDERLYKNQFKLNPIDLEGFTYDYLVNPFGLGNKTRQTGVINRIRWLERQAGFRRDNKENRVVLGRF